MVPDWAEGMAAEKRAKLTKNMARLDDHTEPPP